MLQYSLSSPLEKIILTYCFGWFLSIQSGTKPRIFAVPSWNNTHSAPFKVPFHSTSRSLSFLDTVVHLAWSCTLSGADDDSNIKNFNHHHDDGCKANFVLQTFAPVTPLRTGLPYR